MSKFLNLLAVVLTLVCVSCRKEPQFQEMKEGEDFEVLTQTGDDLITAKTKQLAYLSPSLDLNDKFVSALSKRFDNKAQDLNDNVKVVVLNGKQLNSIDDELETLANIFLQGGTILATHPTKGDWDEFQESLALEIFYSAMIEAETEEEFEFIQELFSSLIDEYIRHLEEEDPLKDIVVGEIAGIKCDENYVMVPICDNYETEVKCTTSERVTEFDKNGENIVSVLEDQNIKTTSYASANPETYTDFIYGQFADEVIEWINKPFDENEIRTESLKSQLVDVATKAGGKEDLLSKVINTKYEVVTIPIYTNFSDVLHDNYFTRGRGRYMLAKDINRTIPITIQISCAGIHNFDEGRDYYIIQQHVTSHNGNYEFPTDPKKWTAYYEDNFYCVGSYMAGLRVKDELKISGPNAGSVTANLIQQYCLPAGENKSTTVRNGFSMGFGTGGVSFGTDGFKSKISKTGFELEFGNSYTIDEIKMTKTTHSPTSISWNYKGGSIQGHRKTFWKIYHDIAPELQRSDCTLDQTIVYQVINPNLAPISLTVTPTLISECCAGHAPFTPFREKYQTTEVVGKSVEFKFDRIPQFEEDWKSNIIIDGKDKERAKLFRDLLLENISECKKERSELLSSYKPEELQNNIELWKISASGKYMQDIYSKIQNLKNAFQDSITGPGPGVYSLNLTQINSSYHWTVTFEITVSDTYDLTIVPKFNGFGWSEEMNKNYDIHLKKPIQ